jgi:class 3 adenylate cyclase/CheY-like chemotaxis protein
VGTNGRNVVRLLIVGGYSETLDHVARQASEPHAAPLTAGSVLEAATRLEEFAPDVLLIDGDSLSPRGLAICRALKQHPATSLLPVVVVSRSPKQRLDAFSAGADDFITPNVRPDALRARVEALATAGTARRKLAAVQQSVEQQQLEGLRLTVRRYLSPRLADRILADVDLREHLLEQSNARARAVVLFADMRGFTGLSERLNPTEVVALLNEYFSLLTEIAFRHDGTVFSMAGDCLMVGFGVPLPQPDGLERAVSTGREIIGRFHELSETWQRRHHIETGVGIGINEGEVVAGNVGSPIYMNYTIIGDTVNVASRLCQRARAGEMLLSASVKQGLDALGLVVGAVELPAIELRGRSTPIDIYCIPSSRRSGRRARPAVA